MSEVADSELQLLNASSCDALGLSPKNGRFTELCICLAIQNPT